jgi:hypothetical protein
VNLLLPWCGVGLALIIYQMFPASFETLFLINIWFFSLPHTFSTITRSDRRTLKASGGALGLMIGFLLLVVVFSAWIGVVLLYSCYFYWQQFHYGKQNFGLAVWEQKQGGSVWDRAFYLSVVAVALAGLLGQGSQSFFGYLLSSPFPWNLPLLWAWGLIGLLTSVYIIYRPSNYCHALSHSLIFSMAYLSTEHFALGWLLLNIFHNLQYLAFMQDFEKKWRFLIPPAIATFLFYLLQSFYFPSYMLFSLPLGLAVMLALNFTHYTLDGVIWRLSSRNRVQ